MVEPKDNDIDNQKEEVYISSTALKKIAVHSLLFSEPLTDFRMVMGMLGGKVKNEVVTVHKLISTAVGSSNRVSPESISYVDIAIFDNILMKEDMFVVGWYVSMFPGGFYCEINMKNHFSWQMANPKAVVFVIYPEEFHEQNYKNFIRILRLKDLNSKDYSSRNWINLHIKMLDIDYHQFLLDLSSQWAELREILNCIDQDKINQYFREWKLFNFEEKNNIISNLGIDIVLDDKLYSLYFTKDELTTLYYLTHAETPDPEDFETLKKIKKDADELLTEIRLTKSEMRKIEFYMQKGSIGYIPGFETFNRKERAKFGGIKSDIIGKLREGYTERN